MNVSYDNNTAVVVLPPLGRGRLRHRALEIWLARSDLSRSAAPYELLGQVTGELGLPCPEQGHAALRMWGQTGDRPTKWIAAADPVYLEARLDHLCLHALRSQGVATEHMRALIDHLQESLTKGTCYGFTHLDSYAYLSSRIPIATASLPAYVVDSQRPDDFLPAGSDAASHRNLLSEIEMALHGHEVNTAREANAQSPVNSLWLWGGGTAPEQVTRQQVPLFSNDALLTGYWRAATAVVSAWPGSIQQCIEQSVAGFVAQTPECNDSPELLEECLLELHEALRSGRLSRLTLLFADGVRAQVSRWHSLRFWRRNVPQLEAAR